MGNLSGESREQNRKDKVTRFRSVTYARQLGLLVNTLGSHLNCSQNIAKKSLNDADSFDDCLPSLTKLENRQRCQKP